MWELFIPIIAKEGLPVAEALFKKLTSGNPATQADFDELRALGQQTSLDRLKARLVSAGIPLDSEQGQKFVALVS